MNGAGAEATVRDSRFSANTVGITGYNNYAASPVTVTDSVFAGNEIGVRIYPGAGSRVLRNVFRRNHRAMSVFDTGGQDVEDNLFTDNDGNYDGFLAGSHTLIGNTFRGGAYGISITNVFSSNNRIEYNTFVGITVGVRLGDGGGADEVFGTVVRGNEFRDNGAAGLVYDVALSRAGAASTIAENLFVGNGFQPDGTVSGRVRPSAPACGSRSQQEHLT